MMLVREPVEIPQPLHPEYPIPLFHLGCGGLIFWYDHVPFVGEPVEASCGLWPNGDMIAPDSNLGPCPKCEWGITHEMITWEGDPRKFH
jgi:hypothetical protein